MKNIVSKTLLGAAFAALAFIPLSAENALIARGERGGAEGGRANFEGEEHFQQHQNVNHYDNRNVNQYDNRNNQKNWNNVDRREWNNYQDRRLDNQLENDYVPVTPYVDESYIQPQDSTDQQNPNSDQQNDDSNFDNQIWDFNK